MRPLPRFREPMIGWPHDALVDDCGCVRTGKLWHLCDTHAAEMRTEWDNA